MDKGEEGFLHQELSVEDDQFGAGRNEIVTLVEPEEFDEYLVLILCKKKKKTVKKRVRIEENRSCSIQNKNIPKKRASFLCCYVARQRERGVLKLERGIIRKTGQ